MAITPNIPIMERRPLGPDGTIIKSGFFWDDSVDILLFGHGVDAEDT
jgi:hypothetical protein